MKKPSNLPIVVLALSNIITPVVAIATAMLVACSDAKVPTPAQAEAGAGGVQGVCTLIEGITSNGTVASICAYAEEFAWIGATFVSLFANATPDAGAARANATCKPLPGTAYCATPEQTGKVIEALIARRRARFLLDAGADAR